MKFFSKDTLLLVGGVSVVATSVAPIVYKSNKEADAFYLTTKNFPLQIQLARKLGEDDYVYTYTLNKSKSWKYYFRNDVVFWSGKSKTFVDNSSINADWIYHDITPYVAGIGSINVSVSSRGPSIDLIPPSQGVDRSTAEKTNKITHVYSYSGSVWLSGKAYIKTFSKYKFGDLFVSIDSIVDDVENPPEWLLRKARNF